MTSSSSSCLLAPTFSSQPWKYDVFLSFRGEDTRRTFVDHLYSAFEQQGISTFKDGKTLSRGESIGPSLEKGIKESQIAVIVFSENYADSSWCLDELAYIMKCKDISGQIVMPIFYDVDPTEVRKQKRKYGEAFAKHGLENKNKVEYWRKALVDASNISGWEIKHIANGHESKGIQEIVDTISYRLLIVTPCVDENLIGINVRVKDLKSKLQIGLGGKIMVGLWGIGGGGKTTLASSIYDEISSKFDGSCFVKNIREESSINNGLEKLQEKILSGVLKQKQVEVGRVEEGRRMIKDRLHHRKVLIILDDVDNLEHLEELAGSHDWFGEGSRIIITTRDEHVLTAHKVDVIHNISLLDNDEAMKLFCKHAPRGHIPIEDYEMISKDVVSYCGGLPLALRVLGRFLCDKEMNEWMSALARLKEIPNANILEKLKISFDGLTPLERELFLEIACFFRGKHKSERVMMTLDACGFHPVIGIKVLVQKALITISEYGVFDMHDLVQEMGHYIVRGEHPNNPEKHSRVWEEEDVMRICSTDTMMNLDRVEAIRFRCFESDNSQHVLRVAANMQKLRWIDLKNVNVSVETTRPLMPENFQPMELRCLTLHGHHAKQLWEGYKYLPNLRMIKLHDLMSLTKTPDFDGLPNLQSFVVSGSFDLEEIHPSFGHLEKLIYIAIEDCFSLKRLPLITRSKKMETLILLGCTSLFSSSTIQHKMGTLEHLHSNTSRKEVASYKQYSSDTTVDKLLDVEEPFSPHKSIKCIGLQFFHSGLRKLNLSYCKLRDGDIDSYPCELSNLQELDLSGNKFSILNLSLLKLPRLKWLDMSSCKQLVQLSELPSNIAVVIANDCWSLATFGNISNCKWLWKVSLIRSNERCRFNGDILLRSMLEGNARDHFISFTLSDFDIWMGFVDRLDWGKTFTMQLPHNWYNDFSGLLMFTESREKSLQVNITIDQGLDQDFQSELWQDSNGTLLNSFHQKAHVGYVSFSSFRHTACSNSISFSLGREDALLGEDEGWFKAALVPRKSMDDPVQTTKAATCRSEFWDDGKTYKIQHDSKTSINILWRL